MMYLFHRPKLFGGGKQSLADFVVNGADGNIAEQKSHILLAEDFLVADFFGIRCGLHLFRNFVGQGDRGHSFILESSVFVTNVFA